MKYRSLLFRKLSKKMKKVNVQVSR